MIVAPEIEAHLHRLQPSDPVLQEMEELARQRDFPIIGPLVGRLCHLLARAIDARTVFEMGSGFGYSTVWFARAVGAGGRVVHTDGDADNSQAARRWLAKAGVEADVEFRIGDARKLIAQETGAFDVVFIDIDKDGYPEAWEQASRRVRVGGLIICDNTLWQGKVADPGIDDDWTRAVRDYDDAATTDPAFVTTIIPLRDGVAVSLRVA